MALGGPWETRILFPVILKISKMNSYQTAWAQYVASTDYATATYAMKSAGMQQPFIDNILRNAFDAAWRKK